MENSHKSEKIVKYFLEAKSHGKRIGRMSKNTDTIYFKYYVPSDHWDIKKKREAYFYSFPKTH